ncbi:hypothetical protein [Edwardsiella tarda]|uniref:hypothetical protein n=1 Tax=Edwardsiella tarda TaxID=636 RepID=UPI00351C46A6
MGRSSITVAKRVTAGDLPATGTASWVIAAGGDGARHPAAAATGDLASTWQQLLHWPALGDSLLLSLLSSLGASLGALTLGLALAGRTLQQRRRHRLTPALLLAAPISPWPPAY